MRNPKSPRRKLRRGNKEWAEYLVGKLTDKERKDLETLLDGGHWARVDFVYYLTTTLRSNRDTQLQTATRYLVPMDKLGATGRARKPR